jgi:hypothetical protein
MSHAHGFFKTFPVLEFVRYCDVLDFELSSLFVGEKTIPLRSLQRRKSESLRVNYISNKDVRFGFYDFFFTM